MILKIDEEREDDRGRAPNLDGDVEVHAGRLRRGQSEHQSESALGADLLNRPLPARDHGPAAGIAP